MLDKQGRGDVLDEGRVERHASRAFENAQATAKKVSQLLPDEIAQSLPGGGAMSAQDSYSRQLALLETFKTNLQSLKPRLHEMESQYKHHIQQAPAQGFMTEYTDPLTQKYQRFVEKLHNLEGCLERHCQQIEQQQETISNLQRMARGS